MLLNFTQKPFVLSPETMPNSVVVRSTKGLGVPGIVEVHLDDGPIQGLKPTVFLQRKDLTLHETVVPINLFVLPNMYFVTSVCFDPVTRTSSTTRMAFTSETVPERRYSITVFNARDTLEPLVKFIVKEPMRRDPTPLPLSVALGHKLKMPDVWTELRTTAYDLLLENDNEL